MENVMNCQSNLLDHVLWISLQRIDKHNAFNEALLDELQTMIQQGIDNSEVKALVLCAEGRFFSAGADLHSMQTISHAPLDENIAQAKQLADVLYLWHHCPKPTLCLVQGSAFGGALGFIAASDYSIASSHAEFCFSEAKLGLIPAVISPYILETMGKKATKRFFLSAEKFSAQTALQYQLIDEVVEFNDLQTSAQTMLTHWLQLPTDTLATIKSWLQDIALHPIDEAMTLYCAQKLAEVRMSSTAQHLLQIFLSARKA
jgi:methylglutaconyl-CoA hydratase